MVSMRSSRAGSRVAAHPIRNPASPKTLDIPENEIARSYRSTAAGRRDSTDGSRRRYISSENTQAPIALTVSNMRVESAGLGNAPVGLWGKFHTTSLVFG